MKRMVTSLLVLVLLVPVLSAAPPLEQKAKNDYPVTMTVEAAKPDADGRQRLLVKLTIQKGYDLFAHAEDADLPPGPVVKVTGKDLTREVQVIYPKGELVEDKVLGDYRIYTGQVRITAVVKRTPGSREPLQVTARVRPYDGNGCLWLTRTLKQQVP